MKLVSLEVEVVVKPVSNKKKERLSAMEELFILRKIAETYPLSFVGRRSSYSFLCNGWR